MRYGPPTLPLQKPGIVRVATLSWVNEPTKGGPRRAEPAFIRTIQDVGVFLARRNPDLIFCAGWSVYGEPSADAILRASNGIPVLYEREDESNRPWILVWRDGESAVSRVIRLEQLLSSRDEVEQRVDQLLGEFERGEGVIQMNDGATALLFICGENFALGYRGGTPVFRGAPGEALRRIMGREWILLNPAHKPYFPPVAAKGFANVGYHGKGKTHLPILEQVVNHPTDRLAPIALIHVNNIDREHRSATLPYASVIFQKGEEGQQTPLELRQDRGEWVFSLYDVKLKA